MSTSFKSGAVSRPMHQNTASSRMEPGTPIISPLVSIVAAPDDAAAALAGVPLGGLYIDSVSQVVYARIV